VKIGLLAQGVALGFTILPFQGNFYQYFGYTVIDPAVGGGGLSLERGGVRRRFRGHCAFGGVVFVSCAYEKKSESWRFRTP
jgi:hypothetical protein